MGLGALLPKLSLGAQNEVQRDLLASYQRHYWGERKLGSSQSYLVPPSHTLEYLGAYHTGDLDTPCSDSRSYLLFTVYIYVRVM